MLSCSDNHNLGIPQKTLEIQFASSTQGPPTASAFLPAAPYSMSLVLDSLPSALSAWSDLVPFGAWLVTPSLPHIAQHHSQSPFISCGRSLLFAPWLVSLSLCPFLWPTLHSLQDHLPLRSAWASPCHFPFQSKYFLNTLHYIFCEVQRCCLHWCIDTYGR